MTAATITRVTLRTSPAVAAARKAEAAEQKRYQHEADVLRFMDLGAPDRATAERWLRDAKRG